MKLLLAGHGGETYDYCRLRGNRVLIVVIISFTLSASYKTGLM